MSELLIASITIFGGFVVFVLGQMTLKFSIEPIHKQSEIIGGIAHSLIFYADLYSNPGEDRLEDRGKASEMLRDQAAQLMARTHVIKIYSLFEFLKLAPKRSAVKEAHHYLIGISNLIHVSPTIARDVAQDGVLAYSLRQKVEKLLNIKPRDS
jgi:hypothetical protein